MSGASVAVLAIAATASASGRRTAAPQSIAQVLAAPHPGGGANRPAEPRRAPGATNDRHPAPRGLGEATHDHVGDRLDAGGRAQGTTAGKAVPRGLAPSPQPPSGTAVVVVPDGYYGGLWPWGFGGLGFGYYSGAFGPVLRRGCGRIRPWLSSRLDAPEDHGFFNDCISTRARITSKCVRTDTNR